MPPLRDTVGLDLSAMGYEPVEPISGAIGSPPSTNQQPGYSPFMRCPLPPIWQASPDSLRQFYTNGVVPQNRIFNPSVNAGNTGGSTSGESSSVSGSSSSTTVTAKIAAVQASITTPLLLPNTKFVKSLSLSKSFQLLTVTASGAARVQLYGTATAQSADVSRAVDVPPPAGTMQNIIADVVLDTAPFAWAFQDRMGANNDTPQTSTAYITVTNLGSAATTITVTLVYVPLENT